MIKRGDIVGYKKNNSLKGVVLEDVLNMFSEKAEIKLVKLPNKKTNKIAIDSSIDSEAENVIKTLIEGNVSELKRDLPVQGNIIKPLYLFLDEEILLYAKLKNLRFKKSKTKKNKIKTFEDEFERKHPEVKRAIVNSILELYK